MQELALILVIQQMITRGKARRSRRRRRRKRHQSHHSQQQQRWSRLDLLMVSWTRSVWPLINV